MYKIYNGFGSANIDLSLSNSIHDSYCVYCEKFNIISLIEVAIGLLLFINM